MALLEGQVVLKTKSGVTLEYRNGSLYTTNLQDVEDTLQQELKGSKVDVAIAEGVIRLMEKYGVVAEA